MASKSIEQNIDDAIKTLMKDYNELNPNKIDELTEEPTALEFMRYIAKNRPFVIRKGASDWQACLKWDADYLRRTMGDANVKVALTPYG
jgi:jumonji domain-containing protein 7